MNSLDDLRRWVDDMSQYHSGLADCAASSGEPDAAYRRGYADAFAYLRKALSQVPDPDSGHGKPS